MTFQFRYKRGPKIRDIYFFNGLNEQLMLF